MIYNSYVQIQKYEYLNFNPYLLRRKVAQIAYGVWVVGFFSGHWSVENLDRRDKGQRAHSSV